MKWLSKLSFTKLDSGMIHHTKVLTTFELCGKERSFVVDTRSQTYEDTQHLLQEVPFKILSVYLEYWPDLTA